MRLSTLRRVQQRAIRELASRRLRSHLDIYHPEVTRLGSAKGGWTVLSSLLQPGATAVCVGVGEDMSFDVELNRRGLHVYTLDPTPRSKAHVTKLLDAATHSRSLSVNGTGVNYNLSGFCASRFRYLEVGLWDRDTSMRFFAPEDESHVSHSIVNLQRTDRYFEATCLTLRSVQNLIGGKPIDILKLDVEGAEYAVVNDILERGPRPRALLFEFDELRQPFGAGYMDRILQMVRKLKASCYQFAYVEASNTMFLDTLDSLAPEASVVRQSD